MNYTRVQKPNKSQKQLLRNAYLAVFFTSSNALMGCSASVSGSSSDASISDSALVGDSGRCSATSDELGTCRIGDRRVRYLIRDLSEGDQIPLGNSYLEMGRIISGPAQNRVNISFFDSSCQRLSPSDTPPLTQGDTSFVNSYGVTYGVISIGPQRAKIYVASNDCSLPCSTTTSLLSNEQLPTSEGIVSGSGWQLRTEGEVIINSDTKVVTFTLRDSLNPAFNWYADIYVGLTQRDTRRLDVLSPDGASLHVYMLFVSQGNSGNTVSVALTRSSCP